MAPARRRAGYDTHVGRWAAQWGRVVVVVVMVEEEVEHCDVVLQMAGLGDPLFRHGPLPAPLTEPGMYTRLSLRKK